ncbi:MAG: transposase [Proteobacteria bacterium]|nr:transposase [Pseudomonadota bacterium]
MSAIPNGFATPKTAKSCLIDYQSATNSSAGGFACADFQTTTLMKKIRLFGSDRAPETQAMRQSTAGKPNQNAFIQRLNKTYRVEVLNAYLLRSLDQFREITDGWLRIYNEERPHRSLGRILPSQLRRQLENEQNSSYELSA